MPTSISEWVNHSPRGLRLTEITTPSHLSWSALAAYVECPQRWLLERGYKIPAATWFATLAGSAIHSVSEVRDRLEWMGLEPEDQVLLSPSFEEAFLKEIAEAEAEGVEIKASGRKLVNIGETGGPNKKDQDWWLEWGPHFLHRWMTWKAERGWTVLEMPDGQPAIELEFTVTIGDYPVTGKIDRAYISEDTGITVFDLKTGTTPPGSLQLKTYGLGFARQYGIEPDWGVYWSPAGNDAGKLSTPTDLRGWSDERMDDMYRTVIHAIEQGIFPPYVSGTCRACGVRDHCWAVQGKKASELPLVPKVIKCTAANDAVASASV